MATRAAGGAAATPRPLTGDFDSTFNAMAVRCAFDSGSITLRNRAPGQRAARQGLGDLDAGLCGVGLLRRPTTASRPRRASCRHGNARVAAGFAVGCARRACRRDGSRSAASLTGHGAADADRAADVGGANKAGGGFGGAAHGAAARRVSADAADVSVSPPSAVRAMRQEVGAARAEQRQQQPPQSQQQAARPRLRRRRPPTSCVASRRGGGAARRRRRRRADDSERLDGGGARAAAVMPSRPTVAQRRRHSTAAAAAAAPPPPPPRRLLDLPPRRGGARAPRWRCAATQRHRPAPQLVPDRSAVLRLRTVGGRQHAWSRRCVCSDGSRARVRNGATARQRTGSRRCEARCGRKRAASALRRAPPPPPATAARRQR